MKKKLTSRKFWVAVVGIVLGIAVVFGCDGEAITSIAGAVVSLASIIAYIIAEACVDITALEEENSTENLETMGEQIDSYQKLVDGCNNLMKLVTEIEDGEDNNECS